MDHHASPIENVEFEDIDNSEGFHENYSKTNSELSSRTCLTNQVTVDTEPDTERNTYFSSFYRSGTELRISYIEKLIKHSVYTPDSKYTPEYNSITIFDWDDTLLPSCYLKFNNYFIGENAMTVQIKEIFTKMEFAVLRILTLALEHGDTYIITNATAGWVEYTASIYYPCLGDILKKVKIISARSGFEAKYPNNLTMWKKETFKQLRKCYNDIVTNVICIGDSMLEIEAAQEMCKQFKVSFLKNIKMKEAPKPEQITKQLMLVCDNFKRIHGMATNSMIIIGNKLKKEV